ncbi:unnamed protein product [Symbiodinium pilosum]|uniref:Uncharacterized protein n=1 Tax=Symbiodinium pilosum TaxID=2952 RepID=A0A812KJQ0_SYMPI|nr:unnamed protein product [Symbiodinium pilosum]
MDGVSWETCCAAKYGPEGNRACWDGEFTFERCCIDADAAIPAELTAVGVPWQPLQMLEAISDGEADKRGHRAERFCLTGFLEQLTASQIDCQMPGLRIRLLTVLRFEPAMLAKELNVEAAINTWMFAIDHMKRAFAGRVDQDTWSHIERIGKESANFRAGLHAAYRPSDKDFPRIIYNNRLIFNHLEEALSSQRQGVATEEDASLPNPLRFGKLCGKSSCYEL